jgi:hypothetical protein
MQYPPFVAFVAAGQPKFEFLRLSRLADPILTRFFHSRLLTRAPDSLIRSPPRRCSDLPMSFGQTGAWSPRPENSATPRQPELLSVVRAPAALHIRIEEILTGRLPEPRANGIVAGEGSEPVRQAFEIPHYPTVKLGTREPNC